MHSFYGILDTLHAWAVHFCGTLAIQIAQRHYPAVRTSDFVCDFLFNKISKRVTLLCFSCLYSNSPDFISTSFRFHQRRSSTCPSRNWVYLSSNIHVYIRQYGLIPNSNTLQLDRPQLDRPTACVIAQQYSSVAFFSLQFHSCTEKFGAFQKCY
jgi:hypothetical protein